MKTKQILKKEKATAYKLSIPNKIENSEMQLEMVTHTYNLSTWELEMLTLATLKKKKNKERNLYCYYQAMCLVCKNHKWIIPLKNLVNHV